MSINFVVSTQELKKALQDLDGLEKEGFDASIAVFELTSAGKTLDENTAAYDGSIILKTKTGGDWGRHFVSDKDPITLLNDEVIYKNDLV